MASPRWFVVFSLPLFACEPPQPTGWTRVTYDEQDGLHGYSIVQANPETDTCVRIQLWDTVGSPDEDVDVEIVGVDGFEVSRAWGERANPEYPEHSVARDCSSAELLSDLWPGAIIQGTLEFSEFFTDAERTRPCRVSFELEVTERSVDEPDFVHAIVGRDVAIADVGCPHPDTVVATYTELDAAFGEVNGLGTLVISSWDTANEVCVWARLLASADAVASPSSVEVPGAWVYSGLRVAQIERETCVATELLDPNLVTAALSTTVGPMRSKGTVAFTTTTTRPTAGGPVEVPCALDLDLELKSGGVYYWDPNIVQMRAEQLVVAGACD